METPLPTINSQYVKENDNKKKEKKITGKHI